MSFSDDDLKRLKEATEAFPGAISHEIMFSREFYTALLSRLKAAEIICRIVEKCGDGSLWEECEAWRKAAGK